MELDYRELLEIARLEVLGTVSPSARNNIADDIASQAVAELSAKVERGERIDNPGGLVRIIARRRAIDGMRAWKRRKDHEARAPSTPDDDRRELEERIFYGDLIERLQTELSPSAEYLRKRESEWIAELIEQVFPDRTDRRIAHGALVEGMRPAELAEELEMAPKTVSNRLSRIRRALQVTLG